MAKVMRVSTHPEAQGTCPLVGPILIQHVNPVVFFLKKGQLRHDTELSSVGKTFNFYRLILTSH